jgi:serine/threonine protein kinase
VSQKYELKDGRIGDYILDKQLDRGSFGIVFEGTHHKTLQKIVIKLLGHKHSYQTEVSSINRISPPQKQGENEI